MNELSYSNFKKTLYNLLKEELSGDGFKGSYSAYSFSKKIAGGKIELAFDAIDGGYLPHQYNFAVILHLNKISDEKERFHESIDKPSALTWSTIFWEGMFVKGISFFPDYKNMVGYFNEVSNANELTISVSNVVQLLRTEAIPLGISLFEVPAFYNYYLSRKDEIVFNFASYAVIVSILMAAKKIGFGEYAEMRDFIRSVLNRKKQEGDDYVLLFKYVDQLDAFYGEK